VADEGAQENGLADAGVAGDEHDGALPGAGATGALDEHVQGMLALEEWHHSDIR